MTRPRRGREPQEVVVDLGEHSVTCRVLARSGLWLMLRRVDSPLAAPFVRSVSRLSDCEFNNLVRLAGKAGKRWPVEKALSLPPHYCAAKHIQPSRGEKHE